PGQEQSPPSGPAVAEEDRQLRRAGPGHQVAGGEQALELGFVQPPSALDELAAHQGDVRGRPTEGDQPELEEYPGDLTEAPLHPSMVGGQPENGAESGDGAGETPGVAADQSPVVADEPQDDGELIFLVGGQG